MLSIKYFLCIFIVCCVHAEAQTLPAFIKNPPLGANQLIIPWENDFNRYDIHIYIYDSVMNDLTVDSLKADSKIFMDSIINTVGPGCECLGFRYINRSSLEENGILIRYWLRNGKIARIDTAESENYNGDIKFPLLSNQYFSWENTETPDTLINELVLCNIITKNYKTENGLNRESRRMLLKLLNKPPPTGLNYTAIRVRYVNQFGAGIIKEYKYPLTEPYSISYYLKKYSG